MEGATIVTLLLLYLISSKDTKYQIIWFSIFLHKIEFYDMINRQYRNWSFN